MIRIQFSRREINVLYLAVIALDAFFVFMNTPLMSLPQIEGKPAQIATVFDFIKYQLDLKLEQNVATWYSSVLLLAAATAALLNARLAPASSKLKWVHRVGWLSMAFVLIALSADETATIHETLAQLINFINYGAGRPPVKVGAGDWIPILLPVIILIAAGMIVFFSLLFRICRRAALLALGGVLCWIGAIFAESIEAGMWRLKMSRTLEGLIEESLEIVGTTLLLIAFTEFLRRRQASA